MSEASPVLTQTDGNILIVTINRPAARNAVDRAAAQALYEAFKAFDADDRLSVAILTGTDGNFCAGADLKAVSEGRGNITKLDGDLGPMGPTRLTLSNPVIAAVEGYAVAGGLELALWCDMRVASETARFGVFCRRFGVPLIDGGTVRLPRLIGQSRAMDMVLTGREVGVGEALTIGLANRHAEAGGALDAALQLAREIAAFPQACMRADRASLLTQWSLDEETALREEVKGGMGVIRSGETQAGATRFTSGTGRHGKF
ncbi:MAG TPA: crotonase/enoyl-CoA hydratase family protein [Henriciella marina]|uniref:crotonase/enoyl-CoA hydratase family protein n=1 Tax=Henriciella sp. TaxID=1968823 RepID=UPI00185D52C8|nr:crotonase/enoyl-CoA hydratase family protein [Henriciella sp.]HIG22751.1 crotonase/enoyl-CoA hydratase family protein [Henriciella sp.]HIK66198.1 crotonase/enoyl-CoA hydratase family protein [Henriciella marina]